jgi:hypothetical protein
MAKKTFHQQQSGTRRLPQRKHFMVIGNNYNIQFDAHQRIQDAWLH